ncbi:hypothetical protein EDD11_010347 [Mortierella claussenii]|nr:hypothetical protein EDD11_010347 [Mortierella claussenii]
MFDLHNSTAANGARKDDDSTAVLEGQLVDLSLDNNHHHDSSGSNGQAAHPHRVSGTDSTEGEDDDENADNISLGSVDTDAGPNALPPTYDLAAILDSHAAATANLTGTSPPRNGVSTTTTGHNNGSTATSTGTGAGSNGRSGAVATTGRVPVNIPSTAEMENLPNDVVAMILETLTILELFDLHSLSERWRQLTTRALLDKFTMSNVVLWIDQEGHRTFRPVFLFDSFDEATNRIRWLPKPTTKADLRGQVYSKTFGINKPVIRIISVGDVDKYDYLDKEAQMTILKPGTRTLLGSDKGCPWAFIYKVSSFTRKGKKIDGERWIEPISFECHLDFLNPRRAHKLRLLWYLQKSYSTIPIVGDSARKSINRSKVEGAVPAQKMSEFFNESHQPLTGGVSTFR